MIWITQPLVENCWREMAPGLWRLLYSKRHLPDLKFAGDGHFFESAVATPNFAVLADAFDFAEEYIELCERYEARYKEQTTQPLS